MAIWKSTLSCRQSRPKNVRLRLSDQQVLRNRGGKQQQRGSRRPGRKRKRFHVCGVGARPDGTGSGFAWVCLDTTESHVEWKANLTKEQAEYRAIIAVLGIAGLDWHEDNRVEIHTDSYIVAQQLRSDDPKLDKDVEGLFQGKTEDFTIEKELIIQAQWIPTDDNLATELLERLGRLNDTKTQPRGKSQ